LASETQAPAKQKPEKKASPLKQLFLKPKPSAIILLLKDAEQAWYPSKLARTAGMSYVHTVNLMSELRKYGIATVEKKGKQNMYKLTERGAYLALVLDDLVKKCDAAEADQKSPRQETPPAHASSAAAPAKEAKHEPAEKK